MKWRKLYRKKPTKKLVDTRKHQIIGISNSMKQKEQTNGK